MPTAIRRKVMMLAMAIADAEGYFSPTQTLAQKTNNPGDLENGDIGLGTSYGKTIYKSPISGWLNLFEQIERMVNGRSKYYNPNMTFAQMGLMYSGGNTKYAATLCSFLGIDTTTTLGDYLLL